MSTTEMAERSESVSEGEWSSIRIQGGKGGLGKSVRYKDKAPTRLNDCKKIELDLKGEMSNQSRPTKLRVVQIKGRVYPNKRSTSRKGQQHRVELPGFSRHMPEFIGVQWESIVRVQQRDKPKKVSLKEGKFRKQKRNVYETNSASDTNSSEGFIRLWTDRKNYPRNVHSTRESSEDETDRENLNKGDRGSTGQLPPTKTNLGNLMDDLYRRKTDQRVSLGIGNAPRCNKKQELDTSISHESTGYERWKAKLNGSDREEEFSRLLKGYKKSHHFKSKYYLPTPHCPKQSLPTKECSDDEFMSDKPVRMYEPSESDFVKREPHRELVRPTGSGLTAKPLPPRPSLNRGRISFAVVRTHGIKDVPQEPPLTWNPNVDPRTIKQRYSWSELKEEKYDSVEESGLMNEDSDKCKSSSAEGQEESIKKCTIKRENKGKKDEEKWLHPKEKVEKGPSYSLNKEDLIRSLIVKKDPSEKDFRTTINKASSPFKKMNQLQDSLHQFPSTTRPILPKETQNSTSEMLENAVFEDSETKSIKDTTSSRVNIVLTYSEPSVYNQTKEIEQRTTEEKSVDLNGAKKSKELREEQLTSITIKRSKTKFITFSNGIKVIEKPGRESVIYGGQKTCKSSAKIGAKGTFWHIPNDGPNKSGNEEEIELIFDPQGHLFPCRERRNECEGGNKVGTRTPWVDFVLPPFNFLRWLYQAFSKVKHLIENFQNVK